MVIEMNDKEFFRNAMRSAIEGRRRLCGSDLRAAKSYVDLEPNDLGFLGDACIDAMGGALLEMPMTDWEQFYRGYVEWLKERPRNVMKDKEEENARGAMLMSLKRQYETQKYLAQKVAA